MAAQLEIFDIPLPLRQAHRSHLREGCLADLSRARTSDPDTSHQAAETVLTNGSLRQTQMIVLNAVRLLPGKTAVELAHHLTETAQFYFRGPKANRRKITPDFTGWRMEVSRRLPELVPAHVRRGKPRVCSFNKTPQTTWYPVEKAS